MKYIVMLVMVSLIGCASKSVIPNANNLVAPVVAVPVTLKEVRVEVFFDFDSSEIRDKTILDNLKGSLENRVVKITGYCDEVGTEEYNDKLGLNRAIAVAQYLSNVSGIGIETSSKGKSEAHHTTEQLVRQSDRKVIIES